MPSIFHSAMSHVTLLFWPLYGLCWCRDALLVGNYISLVVHDAFRLFFGVMYFTALHKPQMIARSLEILVLVPIIMVAGAETKYYWCGCIFHVHYIFCTRLRMPVTQLV